MSARDRVYDAILNYWRENAIPPVIRDLMKVCDLKSSNTVWCYVRQLVKEGRIKMVNRHPVPIEIEELIKGVEIENNNLDLCRDCSCAYFIFVRKTE